MSPYILVPDPLPLLADLKCFHPNGDLVPSLSSNLINPDNLFYERRKAWRNLLFLFAVRGKWLVKMHTESGFDRDEGIFISAKRLGAKLPEEARFCVNDYAIYRIDGKVADGDWDIIARAVLLEI